MKKQIEKRKAEITAMKKEERTNTISKEKDEVIDNVFGIWLDNLTYPSDARKCLDEMLAVHGMGTAKVGKWGAAFLKVITAYDASHPRGRVSAAPPARRTAPRAWTRQEEQELRQGYLNGISIQELSDQHGRTPGAIRSRLHKLGLIYDGEWTE